ncbi:MAG: hypothetical protein QOD43_2012, partial [Gaiellaceae bacterium]|nr:hypothetical protein [Gaiellaceae bacterium]
MSRFAKSRALLAWGAAALAGVAVSLVVELGSHHLRPGGVGMVIN